MLHTQESHQPHVHGSCCGGDVAATAVKVKDPVCGMSVDPQKTPHHHHHAGHDYHFCGGGCRTKFAADPLRYLEPRAPAPVVVGATYTCPMHPEVRQTGPGSCPLCGMALEPETISLDDRPNAELADMSRRFWIGAALALPVFLLEMAEHLLGLHLLSGSVSAWLQLALATPVVLWAGWPFFVRGWQSIVNRSLNMFTLVAMGTGVAWAYSVVATVAPQVFPASFRGR